MVPPNANAPRSLRHRRPASCRPAIRSGAGRSARSSRNGHVRRGSSLALPEAPFAWRPGGPAAPKPVMGSTALHGSQGSVAKSDTAGDARPQAVAPTIEWLFLDQAKLACACIQNYHLLCPLIRLRLLRWLFRVEACAARQAGAVFDDARFAHLSLPRTACGGAMAAGLVDPAADYKEPVGSPSGRLNAKPY
jgi:hypothetical protein